MPNLIKFPSLQPAYFSEEKTWLDFLSALSQVIQEQVREPIREIEDIRHIVETTDPVIIANTIKELGFDLPADLIKHNADRLSRSVYMLSLFHELSGTDHFVSAVKYVLGREVLVHNLYTNNYVDFYEIPYGPLLENGGDWYLTSHINLGMELIANDSNLILPVGKTLADRLMAAYFEFAPINHVIKDFYYILKTKGVIGITGVVVFDNIDFLTIGLTYNLQDITLLAPQIVVAGEEFTLRADVRYSTGVCLPLDNPRYGYRPTNVTTEAHIEQLPVTLSDTNNVAIEFYVPDSNYIFFAYPALLGRATFTNVATGVAGGWDGATWTGSTGSTTGPLTIVKSGVEFYVYRTDLPSLGTIRFNVAFQYQGLTTTCDVPWTTTLPPVQPPDTPPEPECPVVLHNLYPIYGQAAFGVDTAAELAFLTGESNTTNNQQFTITASATNFGYFAYPKELGPATFTNPALGVSGGWDGAKWVDTSNDPGLSHEGQCKVASYPIVLSGLPSAVTAEALQPLIAANTNLGTTDGTKFATTIKPGEYGWLIYPAALGTATLIDVVLGIAGGWDGATWPLNGDFDFTYGPVIAVLNGTKYFVYRTDFPGVGNVNFEIQYTNPGLAMGSYTPDCDTSAFPGGDVDPGALDITPTIINTATGPILVSRVMFDAPCDYLVYRTDRPGVSGTFNVTFEYPGRNITVAREECDDVDPPDEPDDPPVDPPPPPVTNTNPRYGATDSVDSTADVMSLSFSFPDTQNHKFTISALNNAYGYFAYPKALGTASFKDVALGISGGWDGANWPEGEIGTTFGPKTIVVDGIEWYVYRTDFPGIGTIEFETTFQNPGAAIASIEGVELTLVEPTLHLEALQSCVANRLPRFGLAVDRIDSGNKTLSLPSEGTLSDFAFKLTDSAVDQYGWFAHPAALGFAHFMNPHGVFGGWDGATWTEGVAATKGPFKVTLNNEVWYVYRTDFVVQEDLSFNVYFDNSPLALGDSVFCDVSLVPAPSNLALIPMTPDRYPVYGVGPAGVNSSQEIDLYLTGDTNSNVAVSFTADPGPNEYIYFASPVYLGGAVFTPTTHLGTPNVADETWDGASWPDNGNVGEGAGPIIVYRNVAGSIIPWYLYRTNVPGYALNTFNVVYGINADPERSDTTIVQIYPQLTTDRPDLVSILDDGRVLFAEVSRATVVHLTTSYKGVSDTVAITLQPKEPALSHINLVGPSLVNGGSSFSVTVEGYYENGNIIDIEDAEIRILTPFAAKSASSDYRINTGNPVEDTILYLDAVKTQYGRTFTSTLKVLLKRIDMGVYVRNLQIIGEQYIREGTTKHYTAHVTYSDGAETNVLAFWESSSPGLYVDQDGNASATFPDADFSAYLKVSYQFNGKVYSSSKLVEVQRNLIDAISIEIRGTDRIMELSSASYNAFVLWSNGATTLVDAVWSSDKFSINEEGTFSAGSVSRPASVSLRAKAKTLNLVATKTIVVYDTPIDIQYLTIIGPENLKEGDTGQYTAYAHFSDGKDVKVDVTWSILNQSAMALAASTSAQAPQAAAAASSFSFPITISWDGQLTFSGATDSLIEVQAVYFDTLGVSHVQTKPVVLIPAVSLITGLVLTGPSEVIENQRISLQARAIFSDGSMEQLAGHTVIWSARSPDPLNIPEAMVDVVSPGIVQGRSVNEDTLVIIVARYFKETAEFPVLVKNFDSPTPDVPVTHRIKGPAFVPTSQMGSYSLMCTFNNGCGQELALSNDWAITSLTGEPILSEDATIDSDGFLRSVNGEDLTLLVVATWAYGGHSIREEKEVRLVAEPNTLGELVLYGPTFVGSETHAQYRVEVFRVGQPTVFGTGEALSSNMVIEWFLDSIHSEVFLDESGLLYVGDVQQPVDLILRAKLTEGFHSLEDTLVVTVGQQLRPQFGKGTIGVKTDTDLSALPLQTVDSSTNDAPFDIQLTLSSGEYGYVTVPVAYGRVSFANNTLGLIGEWDGASWPNDGTVGPGTGPIVIQRTLGGTSSDWYLYRTDLGGIGAALYTVSPS